MNEDKGNYLNRYIYYEEKGYIFEKKKQICETLIKKCPP